MIPGVLSVILRVCHWSRGRGARASWRARRPALLRREARRALPRSARPERRERAGADTLWRRGFDSQGRGVTVFPPGRALRTGIATVLVKETTGLSARMGDEAWGVAVCCALCYEQRLKGYREGGQPCATGLRTARLSPPFSVERLQTDKSTVLACGNLHIFARFALPENARPSGTSNSRRARSYRTSYRVRTPGTCGSFRTSRAITLKRRSVRVSLR
jgi:hypothetical protein